MFGLNSISKLYDCILFVSTQEYPNYMIVICLSRYKKSAPKEQREMTENEMPLREQRKVFGAKIKNMWEGKLLNPSIAHNIYAIVL